MTVTGTVYLDSPACEGDGLSLKLATGEGKCHSVEGTPGFASYNCSTGDLKFGGDKTECEAATTITIPASNLNKCVKYTESISFKIAGCSDSGLSGGAIAGIVVGSVAGLILIYYLYKKFGSNVTPTNPLPVQGGNRPMVQ